MNLFNQRELLQFTGGEGRQWTPLVVSYAEQKPDLVIRTERQETYTKEITILDGWGLLVLLVLLAALAWVIWNAWAPHGGNQP